MSKMEELYDEYLNELDGGELFNSYDKAKVLKEIDPIAYRVGYAEWADGVCCEKCMEDGKDLDEDTLLCEECSAEEEEDE